MALPDTEHLLLRRDGGVLHITLNRPAARNAMSLTMVSELQRSFDAVADDPTLRAVVLRGAGGHFCAGGDIKDMATARAQAAAGDADAYLRFNRQFGAMLEQANALPAVLICVLEGAVLGGGFGLACIADVALAADDARFGLPETSLGILPAQIAPFVVQRVGLTQARRLALTGARFDGRKAAHWGLVHEVATAAELDTLLAETLDALRHCAPAANRATKALLLKTLVQPLDQVLDQAAADFAAAVTGDEGAEGTLAFIQKRAPRWAEEI